MAESTRIAIAEFNRDGYELRNKTNSEIRSDCQKFDLEHHVTKGAPKTARRPAAKKKHNPIPQQQTSDRGGYIESIRPLKD